MMNKIDWCHSHDGENFTSDSFDTKEEAIADAIENYEYTTFYIGKAVEHEPYIDADDIFERLNEQACDQCGEYAENYLYYVKEEDKEKFEKAINDIFKKWAKETKNNPTFFTVEDIEKIEVGVNHE